MNKKILNNIQNVLDDMVATNFAAGGSCLVIHKGVEKCYFESGLRDVENNTKITRDTIFRLYSMSKPVTSFAVMLLLEQGKIDLLDPISKFLPAYKNINYIADDGTIKKCETPVTIQMLLNMTSGISYPGAENDSDRAVDAVYQKALAKLYTEESVNTVDFISSLAECPLAFYPGKVWRYGFSADVLGAIVEVVSGMKYSEFLRKNVFEPLEMKDTGFYVPEDKQDRLAKTYETVNGQLVIYDGDNLLIQNRMKTAPSFESGGAGLCSTIDDYSHFTKMLMDGGVYNGKRLIGKKTIDFMTKSYLTDAQQIGVNWDQLGGFSYANLLRVMREPGLASSVSSKGEYGWDGWLGTYMMNDPKNDLTILMMMQKKDSGTVEYTRKVRNVVFSAL